MTIVGNLTQNIIDKCTTEFHKNEDKIRKKKNCLWVAQTVTPGPWR